MADELSVVIKTKLEIDEAQFRTDTASLGEKVNPIKLPVQADEQSFNSSISGLQKNPPKISLKVDTDSIVNTIRDKLKDAKFSIKVDTSALANDIVDATQKASKPRKRTRKQSGVDYRRVPGSEKYVEELLEKAQEYKSYFKDPHTQIASSKVSYRPKDKTWQASVQYEDSIGRTTTMLFTMDETMKDIQVTQLKLTDNAKQYWREAEKGIDLLYKHQSAYNELVSKAFNQKNKLLDDEGNLDSFGLIASDALKAYNDEIQKLSKQGGAITSEQRRSLEFLRAEASRVIREQQSAKWGATDFAAKDVGAQVEIEYEKLKHYLTKFEKFGLGKISSFDKLESLASKANPNLPDAGSIGNIDELNKWRESVKLAKAEFENFLQSTEGKALSISFDINENQLASIDQLLANPEIAKGSTDGITRLRKELNELRTDYTKVQTAFQEGNVTDSDFEKHSRTLNDLDERLKSVSKSARLFNDSLSSNDAIAKADMQIEKLKNDLLRIEVDWSKALEIPELKAEIDNIRVQLNNADALSLPNVQKAFTELRSKIKAAGADCKSFGGQLKDAFTQLKSYFSITEIFQFVRQTTKEIAAAVKEIDSATVELRKVTNLSESGYDQFAREAASKAKVIGTSVSDYINSTADFSRLGFGFEDADTMAFAANVYYKVGDQIGSIEEATQSLVSTTQAYGLTASDALTIVDKLNSAGNSLAISSGGIGAALQKSASALAAGNNTLDESIALIAAANRVAQNPEAVGNMWKTVSMRIRSSKAELEEAGEDTEGMVESTAELQALIKGMTGFDILEADQKTFKSTYDIIVGIAKEWKSLEDIEQANVCLCA